MEAKKHGATPRRIFASVSSATATSKLPVRAYFAHRPPSQITLLSDPTPADFSAMRLRFSEAFRR